MLKVLKIVITGILASLYLFPFQITGLPGNTKMMLGVGGLIVLAYELSRGVSASLNKNVLILSGLALVVSVIGLASVIINNTPDYAYAVYIVSMWVWLGAAYFIVKIMETVHGRLDISILCNYFVAVCVFQCLASILIDRYPEVRDLVDTYVQQGQDFLKNTVGIKRKYGIGANLDVAGSRFSAVLIMTAVLLVSANERNKTGLALLYFLSFIFISVQGNAIARTTTVGMLIGLAWILLYAVRTIFRPSEKRGHVLLLGSLISAALVVYCTYLYNVDEQFHEDMRFGFEGFFSLFEEGSWNVASNDKLSTMYVWPDNLKTWLIGDGYFSNPINTDPYFVGKVTGGYYMGTDAGYLRFIFYFGVFGLAAFSYFMYYSADICIRTFRNYRWMFLMILAENFIVWIKVSTDIFVIFAVFIAFASIKQWQNDSRLQALS